MKRIHDFWDYVFEKSVKKYALNSKIWVTDTEEEGEEDEDESDKHIEARDLKILVLNFS